MTDWYKFHVKVWSCPPEQRQGLVDAFRNAEYRDSLGRWRKLFPLFSSTPTEKYCRLVPKEDLPHADLTVYSKALVSAAPDAVWEIWTTLEDNIIGTWIGRSTANGYFSTQSFRRTGDAMIDGALARFADERETEDDL